MIPTVNLWCIHGNLQLPSAWDVFDEAFTFHSDEKEHPVRLHKVNLWLTRPQSINDWTKTFLDAVNQADEQACKHILMGYSLGGRLALHALLEQPERWDRTIIIASHPGFSSAEERKDQFIRDEKWASKFLHQPWDQLMAEWNQLAVFCGRPNPFFLEEDALTREAISHAFTAFSKGRQGYLVPEIRKLNQNPVLYIAGAEDTKYTEIGLKLVEECPGVMFRSIPEAGHRVPWENPSAFIKVVQHFIHGMI